MAFTSIGYDGSVNERQWAELVPSVGSSTYGVKGAGDLKVTAVPGQPLTVAIAAGSGWGHGVLDTETANTTVACEAITSGVRWDLIALRRDWQPLAGGPTSIVAITGTTEKALPSRNMEPGVIDDQPLALVQWTAGQTQPTTIIDLRCWAGNGGLVAMDQLALTYLDKIGSSVTIAGVEWNLVIGANDTPAWVKSGVKVEIGQGSNQPILKAQEVQVKLNDFLVGSFTFPTPFPNALVSTKLMRNHTNDAPTYWNLVSGSTGKAGVQFVASGAVTPGMTIYVTYECWGY
ncbi:hypothetical protein J2X12_002900 [Pseudarthrobacter oxydans]|uniref:Minor tail protein n=1 Tax=Pseudarthrobacter oxydans TaxID=1671 RepID=A0AAW8NC39_PSEOX|nr:hypothetical protein [Pseudarthrobacter oxydans]MDR6794363.1 hypothetical protein [Pseudarthrobacter oxydans]MDR7164862.1 hypothetical protein [Pseudarthrobacter oxydans]